MPLSQVAELLDVRGDAMSLNPHLTKDEVKQIVALYREGWGQLSIHRMTGRSEATIVRVLRGQHKHNRKRLMNGKRHGSELEIYR